MTSDPRNTLLAKQLLDYSIQLEKGQTCYIEVKGYDALDLGKQLIALASQKGATPFWYFNDDSISRQWLLYATEDQFKRQAELHLELMTRADAYIGVRGNENAFDHSDIPKETMDLFNTHFYKPVHYDQRVNHTNWVVLRYPNSAMAQLAQTSQEAFADFYYQVCCANYAKMSEAQDELNSLI